MSTSTANLLKRLQRLDFPECTREALQYIVSTIASTDGAAIPGLGSSPEAVVGEVCQAFVMFRSKRGVKKLTALQELQLLELLCECYKAAPEKSKYQIFHLMFGTRGDDLANTLLTKLISMALSVSCTSVLDCAAIWMQERACQSPDSLSLTSRLVEDYCLLFPDPSNVFKKLPSISPLFVCNFTTSVTSLYSFSGTDCMPPLSLLEHVTIWVTSDCTLCCESVRQYAIHRTCSSPIPGLMAWCVLGPIVCTHLINVTAANSAAASKSTNRKTNIGINPLATSTVNGTTGCNHKVVNKAAQAKTLSTLSKLHLGVLQSLDFCRGSTLSQCLLSVTDAMCLMKQLSGLLECVKETAGADDGSLVEDDVVHTALERMAQVLHVAKMAGCLRAQQGQLQELAKAARKLLPDNRLLNLVLAQQPSKPSSRHSPMDTS